jgi:hypothetical protein
MTVEWGGAMTQPAQTARPNVLFHLIGFVVIAAGIGMAVFAVAGLFTIGQRYDSPLRGDGRAELVILATLVFWGFIVITMGRVIWRGARRRGARDRFGRFLMIAALGFVTLAIYGFVAGLRPPEVGSRCMFSLIMV